MIEMTFVADNGWRRRAFAFGRVVLFFALFVAANWLIVRYDRPLHRGIKSFEGHILLEMIFFAIAAVVLTAVLARISGRPFLSYGLGGRHRVRNLAVGLVCGVAFLAIQLAIMAALGVFSFGTPSPFNSTLLTNAILFAATFAAVGFTEEALTRGYALVELSRALSFWPAAIVMGILFGLPHWLKPGENWFGGLEAGLFGVTMAYAVLKTGSLWFGIGYHWGWDYAESFLFGVPDSGTISKGALMHPHIMGPDWLGGGSVGPEGSVLVMLSTLAAAIVAWALARHGRGAGAPAAPQ
jgi:uncharacterized protein